MNNLDDKIIERYLSGECSQADIEQILCWLKDSDENCKEWLKLKIVSAKSNYIYFSDPKHIENSYKELLERQHIKRKIERDVTHKFTLRFMRYAASILILIGLTFILHKYISVGKNPKMLVVTVDENDPVKLLILEDSSKVWLSAGSRIEYPEKFRNKERRVSVEGKVFFNVLKDDNRPFYVDTETYSVKVLGTSFEINAFKYSQTSDVTLVEGNIEIHDRNQVYLCNLHPGQQFEINKLNKRFTLQKVEAEMYTSWRGGTLEFDGLTFVEIAKVLERHYNVKIIIDEEIKSDKQLVGSLSLQKDINQMMRALELIIPIKYHVQTDIVVYIQSKN